MNAPNPAPAADQAKVRAWFHLGGQVPHAGNIGLGLAIIAAGVLVAVAVIIAATIVVTRRRA